MKLLAISCLAATAFAEIPKCAQLPIGKTRRYTSPKTIESGDNQPGAVSFIIDNRETLNSMFKPGKDMDLMDKMFDGMWYLDTFAGAMDDYMMGQYFRIAKGEINNIVREGGDLAKAKFGEDFYQIYRDNTQRSVRALKDMVMNKSILMKIMNEEEYITDLQAIADRDNTEGAKVYQHFVATHSQSFHEMTVMVAPGLMKIREFLDEHIMKVLMDEKVKGKYRQMINEIPLVYQFFNDNIDFIEISNVEKSLTDAVATDILMTLAEQSGNTQVESMINRNMKFIKKLMTDRALQQQKEKAIQKVMSKNKELYEATWSEEEFNRIVEERGIDEAELTGEVREQIWNQVKVNMKMWQDEQMEMNMGEMDMMKKGEKKDLSRYMRCAGILALMPDELLESVALMVMESCPELDLMDLDNEDMKAIFEQQDTKFIDQLIMELHQVCDMFGLISEEKVMRKVVGGVEVEFYADDYLEGPKIEWE